MIKTTKDPEKKPSVTVPEKEQDIKVIDMKLGELILGVAACLTLAGLSYTYYTFVKSKAESKKIGSIASVMTEGIKSIAELMDRNSIPEVSKSVISAAKKATKRSKGVAHA